MFARRARVTIAFTCFLFGLGCAPKSAPSEAPVTSTTTSATAAGNDEAAASTTPFHELDHEAKKQHMKQVIMPAMRTLFADFDSQEFGEMNCITCHGATAKDGNFEMPSASLPKLTRDGDFAKEKAEHPRDTEFMMTRVVPEMAALMHETPGEGLGCFSCHMPVE